MRTAAEARGQCWQRLEKGPSSLNLLLLSTWVSPQRLLCMFGGALTVIHWLSCGLKGRGPGTASAPWPLACCASLVCGRASQGLANSIVKGYTADVFGFVQLFPSAVTIQKQP